MQQEAELFQDYELKNWELSPRIYKILGIAAAVHLFALMVVSQVDLLGTKACDSPYIGKVCQVLDAAYVGSILLGTNTEFASRDYDKTEINPEDVTFIDVSEEFTYPAGYFEQANPVTEMSYNDFGGMMTPMQMPGGNIAGIPPNLTSPSTLDPNAPAVLPTPNPNAVQGVIPTSPFGFGNPNPTVNNKFSRIKTPKFPTARQPKIKNNPPATLPDLDGIDDGKQTATKDKNANTNAASKDAKTKDEGKIDEAKGFNPKPLEDWATKNGEAILKKDVDINAPFVVEVVAKLDDKGKFVNPKMTTTTDSDKKMVELAKEAILAFSDSQLLKPLYDVGGRNVKITFSQNQDNLQAIIQAETESENKANVLKSGLNLYLTNFFKPKEGSDEQILMKKAELSTQGKNFIINFLIPNEEKSQMVEKNLEKLKEKLKQKQPNSGVAETKNANAQVAK